MRRGHALKLASSLIAGLVLAGIVVYWAGTIVGSEFHAHDGGALNLVDLLVLALGGLVLCCAVVYARRRTSESGLDVASPSAVRTGWQQRREEIRGKPWTVAGWLVVVLLSLSAFTCVILVPLALLIPAYQSLQARREMGTLTIDFDPLMPIVEIEVLRGDSNVGRVFPVVGRPIPLHFPMGQYDLAIRYQHDLKRFTLEKSFTIPRGAEQSIDLTLAIRNDFNAKLKDDRLPRGRAQFRGGRAAVNTGLEAIFGRAQWL